MTGATTPDKQRIIQAPSEEPRWFPVSGVSQGPVCPEERPMGSPRGRK